MNRLVMIYSVGDGFTYSAKVSRPIIFNSTEEALVMFKELAVKTRSNYQKYINDLEEWHKRLRSVNKNGSIQNDKPEEVSKLFSFSGASFDSDDFFYFDDLSNSYEFIAPRFLTIDEWFRQEY